MKTSSSSSSSSLLWTVLFCAGLLLGAPDAHAAKAVALAIGLNSVDPAHYKDGQGKPWEGKLMGCENDARDMGEIAMKEGFEPTVLLTKAAKRGAVIDALTKLANELVSGDTLVVSFSGHGGTLPDSNGDEEDAQDETWCLYDGQMVDDELGAMWAKFKEGVRITVYADSCHSGTSTKYLQYLVQVGAAPANFAVMADKDTRLTKGLDVGKLAAPEAVLLAEQLFRAMPDRIAAGTYAANKAFYDKVLDAAAGEQKEFEDKIKSRVVLISGCEDSQLSADGTFNGLFTAKLKVTWQKGQFSGSHPDFHQAIRGKMPANQQPKYYPVGKENAAFEQQRPWTK